MDGTALVGVDIEGGERLTNALVQEGLEVFAAFWFYFSDSDEWQFMVALPSVNEKGPKQAYALVQSVLDKLDPPPAISLRDVAVADPEDSLIRALRRTLGTGTGKTRSVWFTQNVVFNILVEAAYIYRMVSL